MHTGDIAIFIPFFAIMMGISIPLTAIRLKHRQRIEEMRLAAKHGQVDDGRLTRQDSRMEMLEDRVQVLERIITDRGLNVAAQIEALRDSSAIEELKRSRDKV